MRERREHAEKREWGGRLPSDRLRSVGKVAAETRRLDVALVHAVDEAGPKIQRAITRWAAHRSCDVAGLSSMDWIARSLAQLDRGLAFSPPLDDPKTARKFLSSEPQIPSTVITLPDGTNASQQEVALIALLIGADPDPLKAVLHAPTPPSAPTAPDGMICSPKSVANSPRQPTLRCHSRPTCCRPRNVGMTAMQYRSWP
ncbi:hypothetical protein SHXM_01917 [Streptomyces hygroscopicus]|nr:hypothetical protein [Streptomyces hygroscopicus]AQW48454.1 hypothetical protein SHXM_01917 [Streptomyces hygroscopicus]